MDKARITVVASHQQQKQPQTAADLTSKHLLGEGQQQQQALDPDAEIAIKCEQIGQQTNLQLMQNALQLSHW
jgi:hypothetical protein